MEELSCQYDDMLTNSQRSEAEWEEGFKGRPLQIRDHSHGNSGSTFYLILLIYLFYKVTKSLERQQLSILAQTETRMTAQGRIRHPVDSGKKGNRTSGIISS